MQIVCVIGYGGGPSGISDDEDDTPSDPLDNACVNEVMEKNATTVEEKELHRVTQKNTNFNSIKTNLLGTTCIEIGPIVGCTNGKSMEGPSKPLVLIGTFETRKEPLRILKKFSEDSADDGLNEKTVDRRSKFIPRNSTKGSGVKSRPLPTTQALIKSLMSSSNDSHQLSKITEIAKQELTTVTSFSTRSIVSNNSNINKATSLSATTLNSSNTCSKTVSSIRTSSSVSSKYAITATMCYDNKESGTSQGSTKTIENPVNPEKTSSPSSTIYSSNERMTITVSSDLAELKNKNDRLLSDRAVSSNCSNITNTCCVGTMKSTNWGNSSTTFGNSKGSTLRIKPVLRKLQQKNPSEAVEGYRMNPVAVETNKGSSKITESTNTTTVNSPTRNLVELSDGVISKGSVGSHEDTASKRSSFHRGIIVESTSSTEEAKEAEDNHDSSNDATVLSGGIQVIYKSGNSSDNCGEHEPEMVESELKIDLKLSVNNGKLSHPPFGECLSNRNNGTDDSSEFDDSLEDSGLDVKKSSEISESDEKSASGSGSDSGNENDYGDQDYVKIIPTDGPERGLFVSVDEVEGNRKKAEKLSPDSVLFSSVSEMSALGSSESIPEALDVVNNNSSQKSCKPTTMTPSAGSDNSTVVSVSGSANSIIKRIAPKPPGNSATMEGPANSNPGFYVNMQPTTITANGIYDDISFYKNPLHFPQNKSDNKFTPCAEADEKNIYDDCNTITEVLCKGKPGKLGGSYSFQNSQNTLDSDGGEDSEKVVQRRSDGIEFIGIRKIDSESFLRERSASPQRRPEGKQDRSSSASPKTRRKVNQFFSTIGKKAGAAFTQHVHGYRNKSNPVFEDTGIEKSPSGCSSAYKRSLSTDEVRMTRTQEIYATLTPTSLKFKGLGPVLHKLSKIDLNYGDKNDGDDVDGLNSKDKGFKKHKITSSIRKFLRFGSKDGGEYSGTKYDFGNGQLKIETTESSQTIASQISEDGVLEPTSRTPTPTNIVPVIGNRKYYCGTMAARLPPPLPPRVHSLDLLNRVGIVPNGTVRPARPPPPTRHNRVAPSFTTLFNNPNTDPDPESSKASDCPLNHEFNNADPNNPPSKPKRKASMNLDGVNNGISRDLETTYNHITTLNLETLKLIASQTPVKSLLLQMIICKICFIVVGI